MTWKVTNNTNKAGLKEQKVMVAIFKNVVKKGYSDNWKIYECYKKTS